MTKRKVTVANEDHDFIDPELPAMTLFKMLRESWNDGHGFSLDGRRIFHPADTHTVAEAKRQAVKIADICLDAFDRELKTSAPSSSCSIEDKERAIAWAEARYVLVSHGHPAAALYHLEFLKKEVRHFLNLEIVSAPLLRRIWWLNALTHLMEARWVHRSLRVAQKLTVSDSSGSECTDLTLTDEEFESSLPKKQRILSHQVPMTFSTKEGTNRERALLKVALSALDKAMTYASKELEQITMYYAMALTLEHCATHCHDWHLGLEFLQKSYYLLECVIQCEPSDKVLLRTTFEMASLSGRLAQWLSQVEEMDDSDDEELEECENWDRPVTIPSNLDHIATEPNSVAFWLQTAYRHWASLWLSTKKERAGASYLNLMVKTCMNWVEGASGKFKDEDMMYIFEVATLALKEATRLDPYNSEVMQTVKKGFSE